MTGSYLALVGRVAIAEPFVSRAETIARAQGWGTALQTDELRVFCEPNLAMPVEGGGIIIGTCFDRELPYRRVRELTGPLARAVLDNGGEPLIERCWGGYVFLGERSDGSGAAVLRDPGGGLPCYFERIGRGLLVSDMAAALSELIGRPASIDWDVVLQGLAYPDLRGSDTALSGIGELQPGAAMSLGKAGQGAGSVRPVWDIARLAREREQAASPAELAEQVADEVMRCVDAWTAGVSRPLLELSGGLDSSVVGACLHATGAGLEAVTTWAPGLRADERAWARTAAAACGATLHECEADPGEVQVTRSAASQLPRPAARLFVQEIDRLHGTVARAIGADAIVSGGGGDNVFCHLQSATPVTDHLIRYGPSLRTLGVISDVASAAGATYRHVARQAARQLVRPRQAPAWRPDTRFLHRSLRLPARPSHPWLDASGGLPPGKRRHIRSLIVAQNHREGLVRAQAAPILYPLLSQPLVELCLSIPSYRWIEGGRDRMIVRRGFASRMPRELVERRGKGGFDTLADAIYRRNATTIRAMLADGRLAREGLVDRDAVSADLSEASAVERSRALALVDVESWAACWC